MDLLELRQDPFSFLIYVIPLIKIHLGSQLSILLVPISTCQLSAKLVNTDERTRLILSPSFAYSHSTSCSRDDSCSFDALDVSFPLLAISNAAEADFIFQAPSGML